MLFPLSYILAEGDGGWTQIIPLIIILAFSALGGLTEKLKKKKQQDGSASSKRPRSSSSTPIPSRRTSSASTPNSRPTTASTDRLKPVNRAPQRPARTDSSTRPVPASTSARSTTSTRAAAAKPTPPARPVQRRPQPKPAPRTAHRREIPTTPMPKKRHQQSSDQGSQRPTSAKAASRVAAQQYLEKTKKKIHQAKANLGSQKTIEVKTVEPATANTSPLARIQQLPMSDLARAIVYSEIIGPPRALQNNTSQIPGLKN